MLKYKSSGLRKRANGTKRQENVVEILAPALWEESA
jgi:hypothetical protein